MWTRNPRLRYPRQTESSTRPAARVQAAVSDAYAESDAPLSQRFASLCVEIRGELRRAERLSTALWLGLAALAGACLALAFA